MGAFFLYKSKKHLDIKSVHNVFRDKGFSKPAQFALNDMILLLYRKQLINENNYYISNTRTSLFATGTVIYNGRNYNDTLKSLVDDFDNDKLDVADILGAFCLIFLKNKKLYILTDQSNIYHIYCNEDQSVLSSSFLALIASDTGKRNLSRMSCLEQFLIGYTIGHETLISGISLIDNDYKKQIRSQSFSFLSFPDQNNEDIACYTTYDNCINHQLSSLKNYYRQIGSLAQHSNIDIGLSGGYDSRLNFLLACTLPVKISTHTHYSAIHNAEKEIAEIIANKKGIPLKTIPISNPANMTETELIDNLNDSLHFYDGRTNKTMGTYNDVHTKKYRTSILDNNKLGLNGLGGELYRNHDQTIYQNINFAEWIKYHVIDPSIVYSMPDVYELQRFVDHIFAKCSMILKVEASRYVNKITLRRFYSFIWLPYAAGVKSQSENQLAFFLMPFSEHSIIIKALKATPYIGMTGKFEADMMMHLDSEIASVPSSYGFGFNKEPLIYSIRSGLRCYVPDRVKNILGLMKIKFVMHHSNSDKSLLNNNSIILHLIDIIHGLKLPVSFDRLFMHRVHFDRAISTAYLLHKFSDKISFES